MALISLDSLLSAPHRHISSNSLSLISHSVLYKRRLRQFNISLKIVSSLLNDCNEKKRTRPKEKIKNENVLREKSNTLKDIRSSLKDRSLLMKEGNQFIEEQKNNDVQIEDLNEQFNDIAPEQYNLSYGDDNYGNEMNLTMNNSADIHLNQNALRENNQSSSIALRYPSKSRTKKSQNIHILSELRNKLKQTMKKYENVELGRDPDYDMSIEDNYDHTGDLCNLNGNQGNNVNNIDNDGTHIDASGIINDQNISGIFNNQDNLNADINESFNFYDFLNSTHSSFSFHVLPEYPLSFNQHVKKCSKLEKISWFYSLLVQLDRGSVVVEQNGCYGEIKVDRRETVDNSIA